MWDKNPGSFSDIKDLERPIDITFPLIDGNYLLDCDADWGQGVVHTAKHITNQEPYCAP